MQKALIITPCDDALPGKIKMILIPLFQKKN